MKLFTVILFGLVALFDPVDGATCKSNTTTCVATNYTLPTCDASKICACVSGYYPIRTGCGRKFSTPDVELPDGKSTEVLQGKNAVLTCSSEAPVVEWYYDNGTFITAGSTYTITSASATNVGKFKCKGKLVSTSSPIDSDFSSSVEIKLILTGGTVTAKPTFQAFPARLFAGKPATLTCTNIPMGYDTTKIKFQLKNGTEIDSNLAMTSDLDGKQAKCVLNDTSAASIESDLGSLPTLTTTITSVSVSGAFTTFTYSTTEAITLSCLTVPDQGFVDTSSKQITYKWLNNSQEIQGSTSDTYTLPKTAENYNISCKATYNDTTITSTNSITITRNGTYVTKPTIVASPETPVFGSLLTLACGSKYEDGQYTWKIGTVDIAQQFDHTIQLDNLTTSDAGNYACSVTRSAVTMTSDVFTISNGHMLSMGSALVYGLLFMISRHLV